MVIRRLLCYLKPHRSQLLLAFLILFLATAADVVGPILIKIFIDDYLTPRTFIVSHLLVLGGGYILLMVLSAVLQYWQMVMFNRIALKTIQEIRIEVFSKVQHLALAVFDTTPVGAIVSRITNDTEAIKELYLSVLSTFVQNIVFLLGVFVAMFILDFRLAAFCLFLIPVILIFMALYRCYSTKVYRSMRKLLGKLNAHLNEGIQGMNTIQAMRQEKREREKFAQINDRYYQAKTMNVKLNSLLVRPAVDFAHVLALTLVLSFFGLKSLTDYVEIGVLYAFVNYLDRFFEPVNMMMQRLSEFQQAVVSAERVFELIDDDRTVPGLNKGLNSLTEPFITKGLIEFRQVSFSYNEGTEVLKNISFTVRPGQTVAIVGHTGSGKSTIANLLLRFYPVNRGEILLDGVPIEQYPEQVLRSQIGLVLQDPFIFVGDIRSNIALGRNLTDGEVEKAAKLVQADQFIQKLEHGYAEPMGERGNTLSSGQRQLICFARTMAGSPKILIMDEATASVDTETEEEIQTTLKNMRQGRTTIIIAHRLSTIQDADLILVMHRGEIVERGTHDELLAKGGLYHKMYLMQQGKLFN